MINWTKEQDGVLISPNGKLMILIDKEYSINNISGMPYISKIIHKIIIIDSDNKLINEIEL